jgi:hypothetical protein
MDARYKPKPELSDIVKVIGGEGDIAAAIDKDGKLYVWGEYDETPDGYIAMPNVPANLPPVLEAVAGYNEILCLCEDGKIYAWGNYGAIVPPVFNGFRDTAPDYVPAQILSVDVPCEVTTFEEFAKAVGDRARDITIRGEIEIPASYDMEYGRMSHNT